LAFYFHLNLIVYLHSGDEKGVLAESAGDKNGNTKNDKMCVGFKLAR
jgi:hypothetical protein